MGMSTKYVDYKDVRLLEGELIETTDINKVNSLGQKVRVSTLLRDIQFDQNKITWSLSDNNRVMAHFGSDFEVVQLRS